MYGSYLLSFSVKVKAYSVNLQQTIAKIRPLNFSFFFSQDFLSKQYNERSREEGWSVFHEQKRFAFRLTTK